MRNDAQKSQGEAPRSGKGGGFYRAISGYLRIVSSGASTVASSVKSAGLSVASSLADDDAARDQVQWSGFDKLECEGNTLREVLLLGYRSGFEVWDVEEADNVHQLASRRDGPVSFLQVQKKPSVSRISEDKFSDVRPLLVVAGDSSTSGSSEGYDSSIGAQLDQGSGNCLSTNVQFYSLRTHNYVHVLKFRSAVYSVRCSHRTVAISQASQIHCFDAATLEREYTILTCPLHLNLLGSGGIGYGPLAVGSRWLAYSGSPVNLSSSGRVSPQNVNSVSLSSSPSNGSLVAQYAKESSKQLASGIVTLGDIGYKKLSKYCSELLQDGNSPSRNGIYNNRSNGATNHHQHDMEDAGMVIVRDLISKSVVVQFRAHRSPVSALYFDPSGTLLVTASIHGHNINIFRIYPPNAGVSSGSDAGGSYRHLYRLQRGFTDAVIQDISFSSDSQYIMISSSRGTSHLFALPPLRGRVNLHPNDVNITKHTGPIISARSVSSPSKLSNSSDILFQPSSPITLSVVSRIRNGTSGWKGAVSGAAAAAAGRVSPICGATSSSFHHCKDIGTSANFDSLRVKYYLLVFSPLGCLVQYVLRPSSQNGLLNDFVGLNHEPHDISQDGDSRFVVEAVQKWDVCHKRYRRDNGTNSDIYGENGNADGTKSLPKAGKKGTTVHPSDGKKATLPNLSTEERQHVYLSAVELHTHASQMQLWTKPEIYFQVILDGPKEVEACSLGCAGGEIEIEKIPTHMIEVRSRTLVPAFENLRILGFQQSRSMNEETNENGILLWQKSEFLEDEKHSFGSSSCSMDSMPGRSASIKIPTRTAPNDWNEHALPNGPNLMMDGNVNTRDSLNVNNQLEFVNKNGDLKAETGLMSVHNVGSSKVESRFLDGDDEID